MEAEEDIVVFPRSATDKTDTQGTSHHSAHGVNQSHKLVPALHALDAGLKAPFSPHSGPTQASPLVELPQELKDIIVSFVRREDLPYLLRTSRIFRATTLPFLYHDIALGSIESETTATVNGTQHALAERQRVSLLATVSKGPQLGALIHTLRFHGRENSSTVPVLAFTPNLTTLHYHSNVCWLDVSDDTHFHCYKFASSLTHVRNTLKHLKVSYSVDTPLCAEVPYSIGHCSLKPLFHLESAEISLFTLLGPYPIDAIAFADVLPSSLVHLELVDDPCENDGGNWDEDSVWQLLVGFVKKQKWKEIVPRLKTFNVSAVLAYWDSFVPQGMVVSLKQESFEALCRENRLSCKS
jgi:hypothetical protein